MTQDLIVVGGGLAGLTAAARGAELGLRVLVLEKGNEPDYRCNSRMTGGAFHMAMGAIDRPADEVIALLRDSGAPRIDEALVRAIVGDGARAVGWLRGKGIRFLRGGPLAWQQWVLAPPNVARPGYDWRGRGGDVCLRTLEGAIVASNGTVARGMRALELVVASGVVKGVVVAHPDGRSENLLAHAVVLADGGFQGNREMLGEVVSTRPDLLVQRGAGTGIGDGMRMAEAAGAAIVRSGDFYGHLLAHEALGNGRLTPFPFIDYLAAGGILVNGRGQRIADEGRGGIYMANVLARQDDPSDAYVLFDTAVWEGPGQAANAPTNPYLATETRSLVRADTLSGLAEGLGLPQGAVVATVEAFNAALAQGRPDSLGPPRTQRKFQAYPLQRAPYFGIRVCPGITYTMGGISIDAACRVVTSEGRAIPGLLAAGTTVGGIEGGRYVGYLGGLTRSTVTGMRAAESVAAALAAGTEALPAAGART